MTYKPSKLGQTGFWFVSWVHQEVCASKLINKSLHVVVMIGAMLVNTQTHTETESFQPVIK